jgi:hypothetical protein
MEQQETKPHRLFVTTPQERKILSVLGDGNMNEGFRIAVMWASHFYNLGLNVDMDLNIVGLVTVSSTDQYPHE